MFTAFVTISGEYADGTHDYIDVSLSRDFDTIHDALRWYEHVHVSPFGITAYALHASNPDLVRIEAEYDIYEDGKPIEDCDWFFSEAIWCPRDEHDRSATYRGHATSITLTYDDAIAYLFEHYRDFISQKATIDLLKDSRSRNWVKREQRELLGLVLGFNKALYMVCDKFNAPEYEVRADLQRLYDSIAGR